VSAAKEREPVVEILREHPRFKQDFLDELPADAGLPLWSSLLVN
jgi:hypothetical protein